ncbi:ABC transporter ATP-binding protein [Clostridium sp. AF19-22AC]|jgi:ATP-binding cassette subfamily F protein uup|uniref:ABC-F family ATP-binding cassette domain-containing protein n=1 Tax=Clostridia TaxID=186801 RepID=UPI000E538DAF|nr:MULTISPECIES: ABC-F family ATP-binding cassette domain-containing protein [Clostridia]RHR32362.1 ABC transporter ATP-binding protein [Clostridium sp. AF19-22AC]
MNVLNIEHISKIYGEKVIFDDVSCGIHEGDKIGIIGINGTGKTTLLRIIAGLEEPDDGQVVRQNGMKAGYLPQNQKFPEEASVLSYVLAGQKQDVWNVESDAKSILNHLGLTDHEAVMGHLSGGQKKRAALAKVLVEPADVLILDEPTNHLDEDMINWLEDYLKRYRGVVLMVTHDRYFLDKVTNKILEISYGKLYAYEANYSRFLEMKAQREEMEQASERKRQSVLRMELEWAARGCRARSTKQRARLERLEALKNGNAPVQPQLVEMDSVETRMGKKTIELHHVSKSYGSRIMVKDFDYIVLRNQRLGIVGPNGCGKSTLIKMIAGILQPDSGSIEIGETVKIGYFAQEVPDMNTSQRVIDYVRDIAEYIPTRQGRITASQMLERFLFTPDMQYSPIEKLSGGEKKRLYLLGILQAGPNCLLIDECNDLDIPTLTIFEDYLNSFPGIVITVSHDRYFLDNVVDRVFAFEGDGRLVQYEGGYTDYIEARQRNAASGAATAGPVDALEEKKSSRDWKQNSPVKLKFSYKEQKEYETIDETIAALEEKIESLEDEVLKNATNSAKLNELLEKKELAEKELEEKMERWVYLNDLAEKIEAQKTGGN